MFKALIIFCLLTPSPCQTKFHPVFSFDRLLEHVFFFTFQTFFHLLFNSSLMLQMPFKRKRAGTYFQQVDELPDSAESFLPSWSPYCFELPCCFFTFLEIVVRAVCQTPGKSLGASANFSWSFSIGTRMYVLQTT